ncbi:hypothetical protein [Bacteroides sp.]|uniref:hypothetical protein n=1 Tax=Bacteroides sp. TaxID=29523 RepID=UPI0026148C41|nr:hypothetical protein [Bacteroides sp.]MDD3039103.1 hypothetical protein [Bacteroides sp.]
MLKNTKEVRETSIQKRGHYIHIETQGCIINIYPSIINHSTGLPVTSISIIPDDRFAGEPVWKIDEGQSITRVIQTNDLPSSGRIG